MSTNEQRDVLDGYDGPVGAAFGIWLAARAVDDLVGRATRPQGWSPDEFAVGSALEATGGVRASELARLLTASPTTVSSLVRRLEVRGDLERRPDPSDARAQLVSLTPSGADRHAACVARFEHASRQLDEELSRRGLPPSSLFDLRHAVDAVRGASGGR